MDKKENLFSKNLEYLFETKVTTPTNILKVTGHNSPGLISMWKSGERQPLVKDVIAIANHLNMSIDTLVCKDLRTYKEDTTDKINNLNKEQKDIIEMMIDNMK